MTTRSALSLSSLAHRAPAFPPHSTPGLARAMSAWAKVPMGPPDAILGISEKFKASTNAKKMNLGVGAYRDDAGRPFLLPSVRKAENALAQMNLDKEYAPITGIPVFRELATRLAYGDEVYESIAERLVSAQSLSGTGALRVAAAVLAKFYEPSSTIYVSNPTWGNHNNVFSAAGLAVQSYRYYDPKTHMLDAQGMLADLEDMPDRSIVLLHACAHNPTGVDPTPEQWDDILRVVRTKNHFVLMDMAYQGFASGNPARDGFAPRLFAEMNVPMMLCQSFAKNMGLYGERVGCFSMLAASAEEAARLESQVKIIIRGLYSNPPVHGARIAARILGDPELRTQWHQDIETMSTRIRDMRALLRSHLEDTFHSAHDWSHITSQIGMFCYTGLNPAQVDKLTRDLARVFDP
ncbi:aspartate aminotransferase [Schizosaccharomyces japonicus yFS275]|uniref:Aspartate aminotransferase n=1 Tax=Schizosaccharomyces japonicus (strain yFS275 / FY16936) TaxID=402676 RepID=B6JWD9_SCHJY|nr:aspartate aminotransferase [Schizosaccharomyces japonicus yFS275]EEB05690.1 aspartate aminotransferase [Schizosaccharomyces japonicus yFS275]